MAAKYPEVQLLYDAKLLFYFYNPMTENIKNKKNIQLVHLSNSVQAHKQQYLRRPLALPAAHLFLNSALYLSQLIPTFLAHYHHILTQEEVSSLTDHLILINEDLIAKLKATTDKLQTKHSESILFKNKNQPITFSDNYDSLTTTYRNNHIQPKNHIINPVLHPKEQGETFTLQEDKQFYLELKAALERKQEVLAICHTESLEYADFLQEQVHDLLTLNQVFFEKQEKESETTNGEELKQQVSKSLQQQWKLKIPNITKVVSHKILKQIEQNRKDLSRHAEVQTEDTNNAKMLELKRKIALLEKQLSDQRAEIDRLVNNCDHKDILIQKLEDELEQSREEFSKKQYDMQKSIRNLEEGTRRIKDQYSREKSRKAVTEREMMTDIPFKSIKIIQQPEQPETKAEKQEETVEQEERVHKKKKTILGSNGSNKFILPTLNKISSKENFYSKTEYSDANTLNLTSRTQKNNEMQDLQNQTITKMLKEKVTFEASSSNLKKTSKEGNAGKQPIDKKLKKQSNSHLKIDRNKKIQATAKKTKKGENQEQKKSPFARKENNKYAKKEEIRLPSLNKEDNMAELKDAKNKSPHAEGRNKNESAQLQAQVENNEKDMLNQDISSNVTMKSIVSLLDKKKSKNETLIKVQPVNVFPKRDNQPSNASFKKRQNSFDAAQSQADRNRSQGENKKEEENGRLPEDGETSCSKKTYLLSTPFQRINEDIEKENYVTPMLGVESPGLAFKREMAEKARINGRIHQNLRHYLARVLQALRKEEQDNIDLKQLKQILEEWQKEEDSQSNSQKRMQNEGSGLNGQSYERGLIIKFQNESSKVKQYQTLKNKNYTGLHKQLRKMLTEGQDSSVHKRLRYLNSQMHSPHIRDQFAKERGSCPISQKKPLVNNAFYSIQDSLFEFTKGFFLDQEMAFRYQSGFAKKLSKRSRKLREEVQRAGDELFGVLQRLKGVDKSKYEKVCKQLRYPFSSGHWNCLQIQIVNSMSLVVVKQCMQMIVVLHQKCRPQTIVCPHIDSFTKRLEKQLQTSYQNYY